MSTNEHGFTGRKPQGTHPLILLFAVFGGTVPWTVHLIASYSVANYMCGEAGALWVLHGLTVATAAVSVAAFFVALTIVRRATRHPKGERSPEEDRDQFLASGGLLLAGLGFMAIIFGESAVVIAGCGP